MSRKKAKTDDSEPPSLKAQLAALTKPVKSLFGASKSTSVATAAAAAAPAPAAASAGSAGGAAPSAWKASDVQNWAKGLTLGIGGTEVIDALTRDGVDGSELFVIDDAWINKATNVGLTRTRFQKALNELRAAGGGGAGSSSSSAAAAAAVATPTPVPTPIARAASVAPAAAAASSSSSSRSASIAAAPAAAVAPALSAKALSKAGAAVLAALLADDDAGADPNEIAPEDVGKPVCPFGATCYRKNPQHWIDEGHPRKAARPGAGSVSPVKPVKSGGAAAAASTTATAAAAGGGGGAAKASVAAAAAPPPPPGSLKAQLLALTKPVKSLFGSAGGSAAAAASSSSSSAAMNDGDDGGDGKDAEEDAPKTKAPVVDTSKIPGWIDFTKVKSHAPIAYDSIEAAWIELRRAHPDAVARGAERLKAYQIESDRITASGVDPTKRPPRKPKSKATASAAAAATATAAAPPAGSLKAQLLALTKPVKSLFGGAKPAAAASSSSAAAAAESKVVWKSHHPNVMKALTPVRQIVATYLRAKEISSLRRVAPAFKDLCTGKSDVLRLLLDRLPKFDLSLVDPMSWVDCNKLADSMNPRERADAHRFSQHPLVGWQTEHKVSEQDVFMIDDTKYPGTVEGMEMRMIAPAVFRPMLYTWACDVAHVPGQFKTQNLAFLYDLELAVRIARRVKYWGSEWVFGIESDFPLVATIVEWDHKTIVNPHNVARVMGSQVWLNAKDLTKDVDKEYAEMECRVEFPNYYDPLAAESDDDDVGPLLEDQKTRKEKLKLAIAKEKAKNAELKAALDKKAGKKKGGAGGDKKKRKRGGGDDDDDDEDGDGEGEGEDEEDDAEEEDGDGDDDDDDGGKKKKKGGAAAAKKDKKPSVPGVSDDEVDRYGYKQGGDPRHNKMPFLMFDDLLLRRGITNLRTYALADRSYEPEPVYRFGQSSTGNLVGVLFSVGWTWG